MVPFCSPLRPTCPRREPHAPRARAVPREPSSNRRIGARAPSSTPNTGRTGARRARGVRTGDAGAAVAVRCARLPEERARGRRRRARRRRRRRAAHAARRALGREARQARAAVGADGACGPRRAAHDLARELAVGARNAVTAVAAVVVERARAARVRARAEGVAPGDAELVELARPRVTGRAAAIVTRRRVRARVVLVVADVPLGVAPGRVPADSDREARLDLAGHVAVARHAAPRGSAAVVVARAEIAVDVTALRGLANLHARRSVGRAESAAAIVAGAAHGPVEPSVAERRPGGRRAAGAERLPGGEGADAAAAIGGLRAHVAVLNAERRRDRADARRAELRTAVSVLRAGVARR